jgi:hypothetical protein
MYPIARLGRYAALAALALAVTGCASMNVNAYAERGFEPSRFHTYAWAADAPAATGDPRLDSNPFFEERVRAEADRRLAARGFEKTSLTPDLLVHYHASMTQRIDTQDLDRQYGSCESGDCRAEVYDAGTILIDLVDARTNSLVWRGWAEGSLDGVVDNQAWMEKTIDEAVARILERLPRVL